MRRAWVLAALWVAGAGCGGSGKPADTGKLSFETLADTAGLSTGSAILRTFEPYRLTSGLVRVRGEIDVPEGTRLQISMYRRPDHAMMARVQVLVDHGKFDAPPVMGPRGPFPVDDYDFELLAHFNDTWQSPEVMNSSDGGRNLRGPGMTRDRIGEAVFTLHREAHL